MRDNMYEGRWSPFDPEWYHQAFDKFISTADELFNQDEIIRMGFHLPDSDGSKSSVFRTDAVLNNSFDEKVLRETLMDIYLNGSHRLKAANHDNVHFFQWHGDMSDMTIVPNTEYCEFTIPTETFIRFTGRNRYKLAQYLKRWITLDDILNDWDTFQWHCLLFIDHRIYSNYTFRIDDRETVIRFPYESYWYRNKWSVDLYKLDTNAQCRIKVSRYMMEQNDWRLPVSYITDSRVLNSSRCVVAINKNSNSDDRHDGNLYVDDLADNLEFCTIHDGYLDLTHLSNYNKGLILSESRESLFMSIFVPKFLHEYPIMLPVDLTYRSYEHRLTPVYVMENQNAKVVHALDENDQVKTIYIDANNQEEIGEAGWNQMVRPIVLSDAFENPEVDPYSKYAVELQKLKEMTIEAADMVDEFRFALKDSIDESTYLDYMERIKNKLTDIHTYHNEFLSNNRMGLNSVYDRLIESYIETDPLIREAGMKSEWFVSQQGQEMNYWTLISPMIYIPRELADRYETSDVISSMGNQLTLWEDVDKFMGQHRFRRPIDVLDFWIFEYDDEDFVWRPVNMLIEHHFPDVYLMKNPDGSTPEHGRVFKAFFFYSDTMNVTNQSEPIVKPTPSWDEDMEEYIFDRGAVYRDIFMEKFYWMGIRAIYHGMLYTGTRWEALEYVINNPSYQRFNDLFLQTMDPYFKLGLANYLKNNDYQFPFDYQIKKMKEGMNDLFLGYQRVTNFEMYLDKDWVPSYFDYVTRILDDWKWEDYLVQRPRSTMDMNRIIPILVSIQAQMTADTEKLNEQLDWIISMLQKEDYHLNVGQIKILKDKARDLLTNMSDTLDFINDLDLDIDSVDDINHIIDAILKHKDMIADMQENFDSVYQDATDHNVYGIKKEIWNQLYFELEQKIPAHIIIISEMIQTFNMHEFMLGVNDLRSYFDHAKTNPDDISLIGLINDFEDAWGLAVKAARNNLFVSTLKLNYDFNPTKSYTSEEIRGFMNDITAVEQDCAALEQRIEDFCKAKDVSFDIDIRNRFEYAEESIQTLKKNLEEYLAARELLMEDISLIQSLLTQMKLYDISTTENSYSSIIKEAMDQILEALSYIAGENKVADANNASNNSLNAINNWKEYLDTEESVFEAIFDVSSNPNWFIESVSKNHGILEAISDYLDTVNMEFIPLKSNPTYADIYEVDQIELLSGGFLHKVGDHVYIPNLGSYQIDAVEGEVASATSLKSLGYRATQFPDPVANENPYDSITNGSGLGIAVKAISSKHTIIKNDEVIIDYVTIATSILNQIENNSTIINPFKNNELDQVITQIHTTEIKWNELLEKYEDHLYPTGKFAGEMIITGLNGLVPILEELKTTRSKINLQQLLIDLNSFITVTKKAYQDANQYDSNLRYYIDRLNLVYDSGVSIYGTGTSWNSEELLVEFMNSLQYQLELFHRKVLVEKAIDGLEESLQLYETINTDLQNITDGLAEIADYPDQLKPLMDDLSQRMITLPAQLKKDIWYRIGTPNVAEAGTGYRVGDIVELIPQLPTDNLGNEIHDQEEIIMKDKILMQVSRVDNLGGVIEAVPLIEYAIPYLIWGARNTTALVGTGTGLVLDTFSYEIDIEDLTMLQDENSHVSATPNFDANALFAFKFENVYDLPITYEVFLGGRQIKDFIVRHVHTDNPKHPNGIDIIYLKANDVMALQDSVIHTDAQHYFVYKIDNLDILEPGAGYSVGQDIWVDAGELALKLKVSKLDGTPYHGIAEIDMDQSILAYESANPTNTYAKVIPSNLNNIDDEYNNGYYDQLDQKGIVKPATISMSQIDHPFTSRRFDDISHKNRNSTFMYPDVDMPDVANTATEGDPDSHWYQGNRIDNSAAGVTDERRWNGIQNAVPVTDAIIADKDRVPPNQPIKSEFQLIEQRWFHTEAHQNFATSGGDLFVETEADLPKNTDDWPEAEVGKSVIVEHDSTYDGHRMMYPLRTFVAAGYFVWGTPILADKSCNAFQIDFMNMDAYPDLPSLKAQYPSADWEHCKSYDDVQNLIKEGKVTPSFNIIKNHTTYIQGLTVQDLSVFNMTTHQWENLEDPTLWKLDIVNDDVNKKWGFTLTYLNPDDYSYDMMLYLNKTPSAQTRNANLKSDAVFNIKASIAAEVNTPAIDASVNTGRSLRIRKLFAYDQKQSYTIGGSLGYEMNFKLANYMHYKNEIHLEDIKIYNKSAGRFEDLLDPMKFEVQFKDPRATQKGTETQTNMVNSYIGNSGSGFMPGECWCYNAEFDIHVFGYITTAELSGNILTFTPIHCPNPPSEDISLEFAVYQSGTKNKSEMGKVMIEFQTVETKVNGDGYIHHVTNRLAPVPNEFKVICQYTLNDPTEYEIIISKTPKTWTFIEPKWIMSPTFHLDDEQVPQDRLYITTDKGRFPLVNPGTGKASMRVHEVTNGTDVTFLNLYHKYEELQIHSTPYPMKSVYVQRRVPSHGFIDLSGKLNKPLNKKYFEFWMNGKLLYDEVTIISPTKLFLHGLTSLRNFEIIEINRDPNEYFSDDYLGLEQDDFRPRPSWNYNTYLDDALMGTLPGDNYTEEEQEYLLSPVWKQVAIDHPEFKNYPPNTDTEEDILNRVEEDDYPLEDLELPSYQYMITDIPTLEGIPIGDRNMTFEQFGFRPITDEELAGLMNEEWADEIGSGQVPSHNAISDDEWYGLATKMYDEYGIQVHNLNEAAYKVVDTNLLRINVDTKSNRIVRRQISYDLT